MSSASLSGARYELRRELGRGAMGIVYMAHDRAREAPVALKMLPRADGDLLYRLKSEFRALQGIYHPNLVRLGELVADGDSCFITMELVRGVDFLSHVWGVDADGCATDDTLPAASSASAPPDTLPAASSASAPDFAPSPASRIPRDRDTREVDDTRVCEALRQLAAGLIALHDAGRVHRDLKPSNVLVTEEGRVVILDFGLAADITRSLGSEDPTEILGTPGYMAPEQGEGGAITPAADWYSVGVMLYQALAGRLPFSGTWEQLLLAKRQPPPPLDDANASAPRELARLCERLLAPEPDERPTGDEVVAAAGGEAIAPLSQPAGAREPFVGRGDELARLAASMTATRDGACIVQLIAGPSGIGKSALAHALLRDLEGSEGAVVLPARCHEREAVRYKAFDGVIDALTRYLLRLDAPRKDALVPDDAALLARLFPVLGRVPGFPAGAGDRGAATAELRLRAFAALRELFARMSRRAPVVVFIDDLQWADGDSFALLRELVRQPGAPALGVLATSRDTTSTIESQLADPPRTSASADVRRLVLEPLPNRDAEALARALLEAGTGGDEAGSRRIAREAAGHPLLLRELTRVARRGTGGPRGASLDELVLATLAEQSAATQTLLQLVAVAGRPVPRRVLAEAAGLDPLGLERTIEALERHHLGRSTPLGGDLGVEPFHARVREVVVRDVPVPQRAALHRCLAEALESCGDGESEILAHHWLEAGERARAAAHAARAAAEAAAVLAFDRSARLYELALELTGEPANRRALHAAHADALVGLGRSAEAARSYFAAAELAPPDERLDHQRRAAEHLLTSGRIEEGLEVIDGVLAAVHMRRPRGAGGVLAAIAGARIRMRLRGLEPRGGRRPAAETLLRADTCWSVWLGLSTVSPSTATAFLARHNELAFSAGEPRRLARALTGEAALAAPRGPASRRRHATLLAEARAAAREVDDPGMDAFIELHDAIGMFMQAQWSAATTGFARAESLYRGCAATAWETDSLVLYWLYAHGLLGNFREIAERGPGVLRDAEARSDLFCATSLRCGLLPWVRLLRADPDGARREVAEALARWGRRGDVPHVWSVLSGAATHLYEGDGRAALALLDRTTPWMKRDGLFWIHVLRVPVRHHRACAALSAAASARGLERRRLLAVASREARALANERAEWARGLAALVRAGVAATGKNPDRARKMLERALTAFEATEMAHFVAAVRFQLGALIGGDEGAAHRAAAAAWSEEQDARAPKRLWSLWAPGFA